jgi:cysteine synthase B
MRAFGAELILTPKAGGMEAARDLADAWCARARASMLDQFANPDNPLAHYETAPARKSGATPTAASRTSSPAWAPPAPSWACSRYLKEMNPACRIVGCQPEEGSQIPGIRKWPEAYLPKIYDGSRVDRIEYVEPGRGRGHDAAPGTRGRHLRRRCPRAAACAVALRIASQVENAVIVSIVCDRGDRYLSTGVFPA